MQSITRLKAELFSATNLKMESFSYRQEISLLSLDCVAMYYCGTKFVNLILVNLYRYTEIQFLNFSVPRKVL